MTKINTAWFKARLKDKGMSQRKLAKMLELDPASVSLTLRGKRELKMEEAVAVATLLGQPLDEVLLHAGVRPPKEGKYMVKVGGSIDGTGTVHLNGARGERLVIAPPGLPESACALRYQTAMSTAEVMDGWIAYAAPGGSVDPSAIGRLCLVQVGNKGPLVLGVVMRGYSTGVFNVLPWVPGGVMLEGVMLDAATPVLWVKTS